MADNSSDGSITINTKLDNKGFDKGSQALLNAIKSLTQEINQLGRTLQSTFSGYGKTAESSDSKVKQLEGTVQSLEAKVQSLNQTISELEAELEAVKNAQPDDTSGFDQTGSAASAAEERISELEQEIASLKAELESLKAQSGGSFVNTSSTKASVDSLSRDITKLGTDIDQMSTTAEAAIGGDQKAFAKFDTQAEKAQNTIDQLRTRLEAFGNTKFETEDYQWLQQQIEQTDKSLEKMLERQEKMEATGVKKSSKSWKNLQYDIDQAREKLRVYKAESSQMETSGESHYMGSDTQQYAQAESAINSYEGKLSEMKSRVSEVSQSATGAGSAMKNFASTIAGGLLSDLKAVAKNAKKAASGLLSMASKGIKSGLSSIASGVKKAASAILGLNKSNKSLGGSMKSSLTTMLKYGLGIRSLYVLFNKLRSAVTDGFNNLAQYSRSTNSNLSLLSSQLTQLKNSLATAFDPILSVVTPILSQLIDYALAASNALAQFFAALTGSSTYTKATRVATDYAASQDSTADSTNDATEAIKEQQRQLAGFDDLEVLSDSSSSSSGSGNNGGSSGTDASDMFTTEEVSSEAAGWAQAIIDAWADADFTEIGEKIGTALKNALESIEWAPIKETAAKVGTSFATLINGFVSVEGLGETIGDAIGQGINTGLIAADAFLSTVEWNSVGEFFADALNGITDAVDWNLLGETLGDYVSAWLTTIYSVVTNYDWDTLGVKLATTINTLLVKINTTLTSYDWETAGSTFANGVNKLISGVSWSSLGTTVANGFNSVLGMISGAISEFDFKTAGTNLGTAVGTMLSDIDWDNIFQTAADTLSGIGDFVTNLVDSTDWNQVGEDIGAAFAKVDWASVATSLFTALGAALGGLTSFLVGVFEGALSGFLTDMTDSIDECGGNVALGILEGIANALSNIGTWIVDNIFTPFINGFKSAFGIASPSTEMEEQGGYIVAGMLEGIINGLKNIGTWVSDNILTPIQNAITNAGGVAIDIVINLVENAKNWASNAWSVLQSAGETVTTTVSTALEKAKSWSDEAWTAIQTTAGTVVRTIQAKAENISASVFTTISGYWSDIKDKTATLTGKAVNSASGVASTLKGYWSSITTKTATLTAKAKNSSSTVLSTLKSGWSSISTKTATLTAKMALSLGSGISSVKDWIKKKVTNIFDKNKPTLGIKIPSISVNWGEVTALGKTFRYPKGFSLSYAARGGIVDAATLFGNTIVGEAGKEAIIPLENHTEWIDMVAEKLAVRLISDDLIAALGNMVDSLNGIATAILQAVETPAQIVVTPISRDDGDTALSTALEKLANRITFTAPVMSTGSVMPYAVAKAQGDASDIADAIETSNSDLSDTMVQAIAGAANLIVAAVKALNLNVNVDLDSLTQKTINDINRRTVMFQASPLKG